MSHLKNICFLFAVVMSVALPGCDDCADTDQPVTTPIRFSIVDLAGNNLVGSAGSRYSADSIKLFETDKKTDIILTREYIEAAKGYVFTADCQKDNRGRSGLLLYLSQFDSDTLNVWYERKDTKCFTLYEYTKFQHNGKDLQKSSSTSAMLITKAK